MGFFFFFFQKMSNQKKKPCLQKAWSQWSGHLKALAQRSRTCISKKALKPGCSGSLCMAALPGDGEKWLLLSHRVARVKLRGITLTLLREGAGILQKSFFYLEWKQEGWAVPGFSWGCSLQVQPPWSMASWALVFAELEWDLKYASGMKKQTAAYENECGEWKDKGVCRKTHGSWHWLGKRKNGRLKQTGTKHTG